MTSPLSALGRVLAKRKQKKADDTVVVQERQPLLDRIAQLRQANATQPFAAIQALITKALDAAALQEQALGTLPDASARASRMMQIAGVLDAAAARHAKALDAVPPMNALRSKLARLVDPSKAGGPAKLLMKAERDKIALVLAATSPPTEGEFAAADQALVELARLIRDALQARDKASLLELARKSPKAAAQAQETLKGFNALVGLQEITPELFAQAQDDLLNFPDDADKVRYANAVVGRKLLSDALAFGPLAPTALRPLSDEGAEQFAAAFAKDPSLADVALNTARRSPHAEAIAQHIGDLCERSNTGFAAPDRTYIPAGKGRVKYAHNLIEMGSTVGPEFFDALPGYLDAGEQFADQPLGDESAARTFPELAQLRCQSLAKGLLQPDGSLDPTGAAPLKLHLMMNFQVLGNPTPELARHIDETLAFLSDPVTGPQAGELLNRVDARSNNPAAKTLVRGAVGKAGSDAVDDQDVKAAVLTAMLTPMNQGPVGSCFATAPCRRLRQTDPLGAMKAYAEIATQGSYQPKGGVRVPAVTRIPEGENPLMRSLEYTLASSTACDEQSAQLRQFSQAFTGGIKAFKPLIADEDWLATSYGLRAEISNAFDFVYDPLIETALSNDGSSSQGRYLLQRSSNKQQITTEAEFIEAVGDIAVHSLGVGGDPVKKAEVLDLVKSPAFLAAVCPQGYKPWELASGGQTDEATATMFGGGATTRSMLDEAGSVDTAGARTRAVLENLLGAFQGRGDEMVTIRTVGQHGFNALPNHPSLAGLKGTNPGETASKVQQHLIEPGLALRDRELGPDHAAALFDKEMQRRISAEDNDELKRLLQTAAQDQRPTAGLKPAGLDRALKGALAAFHARSSEIDALAWKQLREDEGKRVSDDDFNQRQARLLGQLDRWLDQANRGMLLVELGAPEFVIADTNWGESRSHTYFVIAPDPVSGEPQLWQKTDPPGSMAPAEREWVDKQWARVE